MAFWFASAASFAAILAWTCLSLVYHRLRGTFYCSLRYTFFRLDDYINGLFEEWRQREFVDSVEYFDIGRFGYNSDSARVLHAREHGLPSRIRSYLLIRFNMVTNVAIEGAQEEANEGAQEEVSEVHVNVTV
jgi:hypothetical protein